MTQKNLAISASSISITAARLSLLATFLALICLASLHILSPEFDPSWRMVSEYALGNFSWLLSLMFLSWAISSWSLAFAIRSQVKTTAGKIGLGFLIAAGVGQAMAAIFDVSHNLHGVSAAIGVPSLPIAAMLISVSLSRTQSWSPSKRLLLWTANLTWIILVLMVAAMFIMMSGFAQAGVDIQAGPPATLPPGVIAIGGWVNRILIIIYCVWVIAVARQAIRLGKQ